MEKMNNPVAEGTLHPDFVQQVVATVREGLPPMLLRERLNDFHASNIAEALGELTPEERSRLFSLMEPAEIAEVLDYAESEAYFREMSLKQQLRVLSEAEASAAVAYLRSMPRDARKMLIELMDDDGKREIALIGSFDEDEIGSRMTTNCIRIPLGLSIDEAMHSLTAQAAENDNISKLYVVNEAGEFYGAIDLKDLIIAKTGSSLRSLITTSYPYVYAHEQISDCIERIKGYYEDSIPILDDNNRLLGVITASEVVEIADDEMSEDYAKLAGLSAEEDIEEPVRTSVGKRLPWLCILLGLSMLVSGVIGMFENVVVGLPLIVLFQSLVLDMAGNVGTQSLGVTIRVLMDDTVTDKQRSGLVGKEIRVGLMNGVLISLASFVLIGLYLLVLQQQPAGKAFGVSACTGFAMLVSMTISSLSGTVIPMLFKKLKIDPAVASGPLITTVNDLCSSVTYYGLAWLLLLKVFHF